jgi:hypothetical protein
LGKCKPIEEIYRMDNRFQFVKAVRAFAQNVQQKIDLAAGILCHQEPVGPLPSPGEVSVDRLSVIKNAEPAPLHKREHIAATETEGRIGREH